MPLEPDVTVAVCTYNRAGLLSEALESLAAQRTDGEFDFGIVVVDDCSTDRTADVVARFAEDCPVPLTCVRGEGTGIGAARNVAVRHCRGRWMAFLDDDETAEPTWLKELHGVAVRSGAPIVGGPVHLMLPREQLESLTPLCRLILGGYAYPMSEPGSFPPGESPATENVLVERAVFDSIGLFETRGSAGEDTNLWARAREAGLQIWYAPQAAVRHRVPAERLEAGYFRWNSMRWGDCFAQDDWRRGGAVLVVSSCVGRMAKCALVALPRHLLALLTRDRWRALEARCALWRASGYARRCSFLLAPWLLRQERFRSYVDFRRHSEAAAASPDSGSGR
jgi:succinoglycan biosynthesis protein ExoM